MALTEAEKHHAKKNKNVCPTTKTHKKKEMYAPFQVYANIPDQPYKRYNPIGCVPSTLGPKQLQRQIALSQTLTEDNAFQRSFAGNTTSYKSYGGGQPSIGPDLHPYTTFVEGYSMPLPNRDRAPKGTMSLFKDDFETLATGELKLHDKRLQGKEAFIIFVINDCPDCQDTKQTWQAFACDADTSNRISQIFRGGRCGSTAGMQHIMYKRKDGLIVDI